MKPAQLRAIISSHVREARKAANLTQIELADKCHTDQGTISRIELGKMAITDEMLALISEATGRHPSKFMIPDDEPVPAHSKPRSLKIGA